MPLDLRKLRRLPERRHIPIQMPQPPMNMRVSTPHIPQITLEMLNVDDVEAYDGREETDVSFGDGVAEVVFVSGGVYGGEMFFGAVEGGEEGCYGFFVGFLGGCEAGFVDAVVDVVVGPVVGFVDFGLEFFREEVNLLVFVFYEIVELNIHQYLGSRNVREGHIPQYTTS